MWRPPSTQITPTAITDAGRRTSRRAASGSRRRPTGLRARPFDCESHRFISISLEMSQANTVVERNFSTGGRVRCAGDGPTGRLRCRRPGRWHVDRDRGTRPKLRSHIARPCRPSARRDPTWYQAFESHPIIRTRHRAREMQRPRSAAAWPCPQGHVEHRKEVSHDEEPHTRDGDWPRGDRRACRLHCLGPSRNQEHGGCDESAHGEFAAPGRRPGQQHHPHTGHERADDATLGSGKLYQTTVERQTEGELTGWQSSMCIRNL